jgi:hypothetical protein
MRANEFISEGIWDKMKALAGKQPQEDSRNINNIIVYPKEGDADDYLAKIGTHRAPADNQQYTHAYRNMVPAELEHAKKVGFLGRPPEEVRINARGNSLDKWWSAGDEQGIVGISREGGGGKIQVRIPLQYLQQNRAAEIKHMEVLSNNVWSPVNGISEELVDEMALPADWDPTALGHDKTFKSRLEYALQRAPRLGGGSSRVAFVIPDQGRETVLKIAKNSKGLAQNKAEADILDDGYIGKLPIVIPLVDYDKTSYYPVWIQTEKANKVSQTKLRKLLHCGKTNWGISDFTYAVHNILGSKQKYMPDIKTIKERMVNAGQTEQDLDIFFEYVDDVADLVNSSGLLVDDLGNANNWGEYQGRPVIIDLGYTEAVKPMYTRAWR